MCAPYASCLGDCGSDFACRAQCAETYPTGTAKDVTDLSVCLASKCDVRCGLACGALAGLPVTPDAAAACQECFATNPSACMTGRACGTSPSCDAINRCAHVFAPPDGLQACLSAHGEDPTLSFMNDGGTDYARFVQTYQATCKVQCGKGHFWACLGHVSSPVPSSSTTFHFWPSDPFVNANIYLPGVTVSVCETATSMCTTTLGTGVTGMNGEASFTVPNGVNSTIMTALDGFLDISAPGFLRTVFKWGFPLSEPDFYAYYPIARQPEFESVLGGLTALDGSMLSQDPTLGVLSVSAFDCLYQAAPNVEITLDPTLAGTTQSFRVVSSVMSAVTDDVSGALFFVNVPPGVVHVTAKSLDANRVSSVVTVSVPAYNTGTIAGAALFPQ
jgi:hypothetical protein